MTAKKLTPKQLATAIKKEQKLIAQSRDRLRKLVYEADDLADEWDEAIDTLSDAVDALSKSQ